MSCKVTHFNLRYKKETALISKNFSLPFFFDIVMPNLAQSSLKLNSFSRTYLRYYKRRPYQH